MESMENRGASESLGSSSEHLQLQHPDLLSPLRADSDNGVEEDEMEEMEEMEETGEREDSGTVLSFDLSPECAGLRLDLSLFRMHPEHSRTFLQKLVTKGKVLVNGEVEKLPGRKMVGGERVLLTIPRPAQIELLPEPIPLDVLYEDSDVIVINKPKGLVVHPAPGHHSHTLVNALLYHCKDLSGINGVERPGIVHRIDQDTTGVLVMAKNDNAHIHLSEQIKAHSMSRRYRAIVIGNLKEDEGTVDLPLGRNPRDRKKMAVVERNGRRAVTHYRVLERFRDFSYIECVLETGRTHQIRVHMASLSHPILGDALYGPAKCPFALRGQTLHAMLLGFVHPRTGEYMEFQAPLPDYFEELLETLRKRQGTGGDVPSRNSFAMEEKRQ